jgi:acetyltransferase-like isoleucine patch superfamily enzyme
MDDADPALRPELLRSVLAGRLADLRLPGRRAERALLRAILRLEGGPFRSATARDVLRERHGIEIGAYSYGACFRPGALPAGVTIGRYVSMAEQVGVFRRNHPSDRLSMHPFFYNARLGGVRTDTIASVSLEIGHDAWIGHQALLLPGCRHVGIGAVIGAGAVVTRDVPDFAVVTGNPARVQRLRFPDEVCDAILRSRWWELPAERLLRDVPAMLAPLDDGWTRHPLLDRAA